MPGLRTTTRLSRKKETQTAVANQEIRERAMQAAQNIETSYMDLAEALFDIKNSEFYREWGIATFSDYASAELGIGDSKANALVKIWDKMKSLGLSRDRLTAIGWSKARAMIRVVDLCDPEDLFENAEKMSFLEFEAHVRNIQGLSPAPPKSGNLVFRIPAGTAEANNIAEAVEAAKKVFGIENDALALAAACQQWFLEYGNEALVLPLEQVLPILNRTYGGKFHHEAGDITDALTDNEVEEALDDVEDINEAEPWEDETSEVEMEVEAVEEKPVPKKKAKKKAEDTPKKKKDKKKKAKKGA